MVTFKEAAYKLDVSECCLSVKGSKYREFVHGSGRSMRFDLQAYTARESEKEVFIARVQLFVEYMLHEIEITYTQMAKLSGVHFQAIAKHSFSHKSAVKIKNGCDMYVNEFNEFYGWEL